MSKTKTGKARRVYRDLAVEAVIPAFSEALENTNRANLEERVNKARKRVAKMRKNLADLRELIPETLRQAPKAGEEPSKGFTAISTAREALESAESALKQAEKALDNPAAKLRTFARLYLDDVFFRAFRAINAGNEAERIEREQNIEILAQLHENMVRRSAKLHNRTISATADIREILSGALTSEQATELFG